MSVVRFRIALMTFAMVAIAPAFADEPIALPAGVSAGASVEGISEYHLANGLTVLLFPDASKPTTTVNITYKVGSLQENYGETGMAHLLEHMMFKGTPTEPAIPAEMKKRGMEYNASTWLDRTNYFETFNADDAQLAFALNLEADRMVNSNVARKDLDSEMTVVRNEMEAGENSPFNVLLGRMMSTAFLWHNYGHDTIGNREDVENVPIPRLQAFYRTYYQPDNAVLLVAGRFDPAKTLAMIAGSFGKIAKPTRVLAPQYTVEPVQDGEREVTVRRVGDDRLIGLVYHIPAASHPDNAALSVLGEVLGDTPRGRLHKTLVETKLATGAGSFSFDLRQPGAMLFYAQAPKESDLDGLADKLIAQVEDSKQPFTDAEVDTAKASILKDTEQALNDANQVGVLMSEAIAAGDWRLFFIDRDRIQAVTAADVNRVAQAYLKPSNRTLGRFIPTPAPDRAEIPAAPDIAAQVRDYKGRAAVAAGEVFDASPANIEARTERGALANGGKFALLPKKTRGNTVHFDFTLHFGDEKSLQDRKHVADAVGAMLMRGSRNLTREQIATRLDQLKATVNINGGAEEVDVSGQTTRENLPAVLDLIAELLRSPAFPAAELEQYRSQSITGIETQLSEPEAIASNALGRHFSHWPKGHPRYAESFAEMLAGVRAVTLEQVKAFHEQFYGANHGEYAVVGDFDSAEVKAKLGALFGDWNSKASYARIADPYQAFAVVDESYKTPDKANGMLLMSTTMPISRDSAEFPALLVADNIFGGGTLKSRLGDRVRQKDGLSYGVGTQFDADRIDQNASLVGYAIAAPENLAKVELDFRDELARLVKDGVTADEVSTSVAGLLKERQAWRADDGNLALKLNSDLFIDHTMKDLEKLEATLQAMDADSVTAAARKYFKPEAMSYFTAGDLDAAAKKAAAKP